MTTRGSYVHKPVVNFRGHPKNVSFMQFYQNVDGFGQNDSQVFSNSYSYNSINKTH